MKKIYNKGTEFSSSKVTKLLIALLICFILFFIVKQAFSNESEIDNMIEICKSSVDAREFLARNTYGSGRSGGPLLCKTIPLVIPEKNYLEIASTNFTKAVMMNVADRSMDCWYMFGEGMYDKNVFGGFGIFEKNKCFTCFTFKIDETHVNYEPTLIYPFDEFLYSEPYRPIPYHRPFCSFDDKYENCITHSSPECERKGGFCIDNRETLIGFIEYEKWDCDSKNKKCYISPEMVQTYSQFMLNKAYGVFTVDPKLLDLTEDDLNQQQNININKDKGFVKDKEYGIAFISHTRDAGWTVVGFTAAVTGVALTVATGGTFGLIVLGKAALLTATGVASDHVSGIMNRQPSTIYIAENETLNERCRIVGDFNT